MIRNIAENCRLTTREFHCSSFDGLSDVSTQQLSLSLSHFFSFHANVLFFRFCWIFVRISPSYCAEHKKIKRGKNEVIFVFRWKRHLLHAIKKKIIQGLRVCGVAWRMLSIKITPRLYLRAEFFQIYGALYRPQKYLSNHSLLRILLQNGNWITFIMPLHFLRTSSEDLFSPSLPLLSLPASRRWGIIRYEICAISLTIVSIYACIVTMCSFNISLILVQ